MDTDDLEPPRKTIETPDMQVMSIEQLQDYIEELQAEIDRAHAAIDGKQGARGAAEAVFKC